MDIYIAIAIGNAVMVGVILYLTRSKKKDAVGPTSPRRGSWDPSEFHRKVALRRVAWANAPIGKKRLALRKARLKDSRVPRDVDDDDLFDNEEMFWIICDIFDAISDAEYELYEKASPLDGPEVIENVVVTNDLLEALSDTPAPEETVTESAPEVSEPAPSTPSYTPSAPSYEPSSSGGSSYDSGSSSSDSGGGGGDSGGSSD